MTAWAFPSQNRVLRRLCGHLVQKRRRLRYIFDADDQHWSVGSWLDPGVGIINACDSV
jgi:hypothetical protein